MQDKGLNLTDKERQSWGELHQLAGRIRDLDPWSWLSMGDCFGIQLPEQTEPFFVFFDAPADRPRTLRILSGWKALYIYIARVYQNQGDRFEPWLFEVRLFEVVFLNEQFTFNFEVELLNALQIPRQEGFNTPVFRSILPGYQPWVLNSGEQSLVKAILYQTYGMIMRLESEPDLVRQELPRKILVKGQNTKGEWQESWVPVKIPPDEEIEVDLDIRNINYLRQHPQLPVTVQMELIMVPLNLGYSGKRPLTPYVFIVVDKRNGLVLTAEALYAPEGILKLWTSIPHKILPLFKKIGGCPATIEVRSERMTSILRPIGEILPFKLVRRTKLETLDTAFKALSQSIIKQKEREEGRE